MSNLKRILMTADAVGGVWTYALELSCALQDYAVHVDLATMGPALTAAQHRALRKLKNISLHESQFKLEWMDEPWDDVRAAGKWLLDSKPRLSPISFTSTAIATARSTGRRRSSSPGAPLSFRGTAR